MENRKIKITTEFIKLDQLLKFAGIAYSGAEAKSMIADGCAALNGEVCLMRGRKVYPGDAVTLDFGDQMFELTVI